MASSSSFDGGNGRRHVVSRRQRRSSGTGVSEVMNSMTRSKLQRRRNVPVGLKLTAYGALAVCLLVAHNAASLGLGGEEAAAGAAAPLHQRRLLGEDLLAGAGAAKEGEHPYTGVVDFFNTSIVDHPFCAETGYIGLHIFLIIYFFIGMAIICDDYFGKCLDTISERLELSDSVAGATFLAAGSSTPELFMSIMGALYGTDVGIATIVGSAVFNITIIIGVSAVFVPYAKVKCTHLNLDYRPLFRDLLFYSMSIGMMLIFFAVATPAVVDWWESLLLVLGYCLYIYVMTINEKLMAWMSEKFGPPQGTNKVANAGQSDTTALNGSTAASGTSSGAGKGKGMGGSSDAAPEDVTASDAADEDEDEEASVFSDKTQAVAAVSVGDAGRLTWTGAIEIGPGFKPGSGASKGEGGQDDEESDSFIFSGGWSGDVTWVTAPPAAGSTNLKIVAINEFDGDAAVVAKDLERSGNSDDATDDDRAAVGKFGVCVLSDPAGSSFLNPAHENPYYDYEPAWYEFGKKDAVGKFFFILAFPMKAVFHATLHPWAPKLTVNTFIYTFVMSLVHITWLSVGMHDLAMYLGCILKANITIMGLTVLAVGTSVPDALGSIIETMENKGDMAVSNAIGSNVFDILLCLGAPWLFKSMTGAKIIIHATNDIGVYVGCLYAILLLCILVLKFSGWKLYPKVGAVMTCLYAGYMIFAILYSGGCTSGAGGC